jgi:hypothetical protein
VWLTGVAYRDPTQKCTDQTRRFPQALLERTYQRQIKYTDIAFSSTRTPAFYLEGNLHSHVYHCKICSSGRKESHAKTATHRNFHQHVTQPKHHARSVLRTRRSWSRRRANQPGTPHRTRRMGRGWNKPFRYGGIFQSCSWLELEPKRATRSQWRNWIRMSVEQKKKQGLKFVEGKKRMNFGGRALQGDGRESGTRLSTNSS